MTTGRVLLGVLTMWIGLVVCTAWASMGAAALGHLTTAQALHHTSWMFVLAGAMSSAAGLVIALVMALADDVRADRCVSPRVSRGLYRPIHPTTIVGHRHGSPRS